MFVVNKKGLALIKKVNELFTVCNELGIVIDYTKSATSLLNTNGHLVYILSEKGITRKKFNKVVGGEYSWEACLPYLKEC